MRARPPAVLGREGLKVKPSVTVKCGSAAFVGIAVLLVICGAGCKSGHPGSTEATGRMATRTIEQVQQEHTDAWMEIPGVVGTAIGEFKVSRAS